MVGGLWLLVVLCCLLFVDHCALRVGRCLLCVVCCELFVLGVVCCLRVRSLLGLVCCLMVFICLLLVACCRLLIRGWSLVVFANRHLLFVVH